jgi:hypothetical protein
MPGKQAPLAERFWAKVQKTEGCWNWTAGGNGVGYGIIWSGVKRECAHRVSWELAHGPIPEGKWVLHRCDNPGCVNPEHLFLGDNTANVRDMHSKGRGWGGIGPDTAYAILWCSASGMPRKKIMDEYGVSLHVVKDIVARRCWLSLQQSHD